MRMEDARSRAKDAAARAGANLRSAASWLRRRAEHHLLRQRPEFWVDERVVKSCYGCEREFPGSMVFGLLDLSPRFVLVALGSSTASAVFSPVPCKLEHSE